MVYNLSKNVTFTMSSSPALVAYVDTTLRMFSPIISFIKMILCIINLKYRSTCFSTKSTLFGKL